jgi:hypothetical protein
VAGVSGSHSSFSTMFFASQRTSKYTLTSSYQRVVVFLSLWSSHTSFGLCRKNARGISPPITSIAARRGCAAEHGTICSFALERKLMMSQVGPSPSLTHQSKKSGHTVDVNRMIPPTSPPRILDRAAPSFAQVDAPEHGPPCRRARHRT